MTYAKIIETEKPFQPIRLEITFNNQKDFDDFYELLKNTSNGRSFFPIFNEMIVVKTNRNM